MLTIEKGEFGWVCAYATHEQALTHEWKYQGAGSTPHVADLPLDVLGIVVHKLGKDAFGINRIFSLLAVQTCTRASCVLGTNPDREFAGLRVCRNLRELTVVCKNTEGTERHVGIDSITSRQSSRLASSLTKDMRLRRLCFRDRYCDEGVWKGQSRRTTWRTPLWDTLAALDWRELREIDCISHHRAMDDVGAPFVRMLASCPRLHRVRFLMECPRTTEFSDQVAAALGASRADLKVWDALVAVSPSLVARLENVTTLVLRGNLWLSGVDELYQLRHVTHLAVGSATLDFWRTLGERDAYNARRLAQVVRMCANLQAFCVFDVETVNQNWHAGPDAIWDALMVAMLERKVAHLTISRVKIDDRPLYVQRNEGGARVVAGERDVDVPWFGVAEATVSDVWYYRPNTNFMRTKQRAKLRLDAYRRPAPDSFA